jgi:hypothetical protein
MTNRDQEKDTVTQLLLAAVTLAALVLAGFLLAAWMMPSLGSGVGP